MASGEAQAKLSAGRLETVAWSPASSLWGQLVNNDVDAELAPPQSASIVKTPLVIAMWEDVVEDLGGKIGFGDLRDAATSDPSFKLVHTNPDFSTSGLASVVAEYYAATGKRANLSEDDVAAARATVREIERAVVHYGDQTGYIEQRLLDEGADYASAAVMEEVTLVDYNRKREGRPKLVAVYPEEGTFYSDNPFYVLDGDWVQPQQAEAARVFQRYLAKEITADVAGKAGFRPADGEAAGSLAELGADLDQPASVFGQPDPAVVASIKRTWRRDRKPARVQLVLDVSGSMDKQGRLAAAKDGLRAFIRELEQAPQDEVGLTVFSSGVRERLKPQGITGGANKLRKEVGRLRAGGGTWLYDAAVSAVQGLREGAGPGRISAVVLLTDGADHTSKQWDATTALQELARERDALGGVKLYTIAYTGEAKDARAQLEKLAAATGGRAYVGDTDDIETVYRSISSFF
jgi:Ca-activated chloride channel homolog